MAAEGEERLLTMYADVHYYFTEPSPRPASHRMDKGSYVYLYRQATPHRARLEVANYAGTENQDAFTGYLDHSKIVNKYKHPTLVTVQVDGAISGASQTQEGEHHWRLPSTDPRDEGKYLFRLHTLDIYFWTVEDARTFLNQARSALRPEQFDIDLPPPPAHPAQMSPVVQQLENVAISDPAYSPVSGAGQQKPEGPNRTLSQQQQHQQQQQQQQHQQQQQQQQQQPPPTTTGNEATASTNFTPMAYNPAAPAAPEKRAHREKTPPPADEAAGTPGLAGAPAAAPSPSGGAPSPYNPSTWSAPGASAPTAAGSPHSGYVPAPGDPNAHLYSPAASSTTAAAMPGSSSAAGAPGAAGGAVHSPTAQILGDSYVGGKPQAPLAHVQPQYADYLASRPQPPPGGFANYNYAQQPPQPQPHHQQPHHGAAPYGHATGDHAIHAQVYRPTEEEHYRPPKKAATSAEGGPGRYQLEERAEKVEKKFNKFLKKVEKKIG